jgi:hypothetical protein
METSREDVGIAIRSAFLKKGTQQKQILLLEQETTFFTETIS